MPRRALPAMLIALLLWPMAALSQDVSGSSGLAGFIERQLSSPGQQVRLNGLQGALSDSITLTSITIADNDGIWFEITAPRLIWNRSALLSGRLEISELAADAIVIRRPPNDDINAPRAEARAIAVPELPVAVSIDTLRVPRIDLGAPVLGFEARLSVDGRLQLANGGFDAALDITRLDGATGQFAVASRFDPDTRLLVIDAGLEEPAGGIIATALGLDGTPPVRLAINGDGPIDAIAVDIDLDVDGKSVLAGTAITRAASGGIGLRFDVGGPLAEIVPTDVAQFLGDENRLGGNAVFFDDGRLALESLRLEGGALQLSGSAARNAEGAFDSAKLALTLTPDPGATFLPIPIGEGTRIRTGGFRLDYDRERDKPLDLSMTLDDLTTAAASVASVDFAMTGTLDANAALAFAGTGSAQGIGFADPQLAALVGTQIDLALDGVTQSDQPFRVNAMTVTGADYRANLQGTLDGTTFDGTIRATLDDIADAAALGGIAAEGTATAALEATIDALTGAFTLNLDADADVGIKDDVPWSRLLATALSVNGTITRDTTGTRFDDVALRNRDIDVVLSGLVAQDGNDLSLVGKLSDLALVTDLARGATSLDIALTGAAPSPDVTAALRLQDGAVGGLAARNLAVGFAGNVSAERVAGDLSTGGTLDGSALDLSTAIAADRDRVRLDTIDGTWGRTRLVGALTHDSDSGLARGTLSITTSEIARLAALAGQQAAGAAELRVDLDDANRRQNASVSGTLNGLAVADARLERATLDVRLNDLLGQIALAGSVNANGVATDDVAIGALRLRANGSRDTTDFTLDADMVTIAQASTFGIAPASLSARGTYAAATNRLLLTSASLRNGQGIDVNTSGSVALSGPTLDLRIAGEAPLALAEPLLASRGTRVGGTARFDIRALGDAASPRLDGLVSVAGGTLTDPLSNISLNAINLLAGLDGTTARINRFNAQVGTGGSVSASGSVGLDAAMPADLSVTLGALPYSDGQTFATTLNGTLRLSGPLAADPLLSGTVNLGRTDIAIPETLGAASDLLDVNHDGPDAATAETLARIRKLQPRTDGGGNAPLRLDLVINAPSQIFVRGRGLDAELGGSVAIAGTTANVMPTGRFSLRRGRFEILGQRFDFETGTITIVGDLDPQLNFRAATRAADITAFITLSGPPSDLAITFSSAPALPDDEIIARLLFGRSVGEMSPVQLLRLSAALGELTGEPGLDLVSRSRDLLGLADLDVADDGEGNVAVRAGTYINDRVYLGVETGRETEASINLDITDQLKARGSVSTEGESTIGIFFERDY